MGEEPSICHYKILSVYWLISFKITADIGGAVLQGSHCFMYDLVNLLMFDHQQV